MGGEKKPLGMSFAARTAADGVGARGWLEMGWEKKPLGMSELGCADGCGRRGCKGVAGNVWGEEAAGDQRACLRGRLRTAWVQGSGWKWVGEKTAGDERALDVRKLWVQGGGWKWMGRRSRWRSASLAARTAADGVGAGSGWGEEE